MNLVKKIYCRTFQLGLRIALPFLPYRKPTVVNHISALPPILERSACSRVLVVTDAGICRLGLIRSLEQELSGHGISCFVYDRTVANPTTANVAEAVDLYRKNRCGAIIGFGGGSSIDCAKAVGAKIAKPKQSLSQMKGILKIHKKTPLLIAIPTTAGTGSIENEGILGEEAV